MHLPSLQEAKLSRQISKVKKYVIGGAPNYFIIMNLSMDVLNVVIHLSLMHPCWLLLASSTFTFFFPCVNAFMFWIAFLLWKHLDFLGFSLISYFSSAFSWFYTSFLFYGLSYLSACFLLLWVSCFWDAICLLVSFLIFSDFLLVPIVDEKLLGPKSFLYSLTGPPKHMQLIK